MEKTTPLVLFRADEGPQVGWGHLMRCRTLAHALEGIDLATGWCRAADATEDLPFPANQVWKTPAGASLGGGLLAVARQSGAAVVVVDHYGFRTTDFTGLVAAGYPLVVIDDLADRMLPANLIVNPNPGFPPERYAGKARRRVLAGEKFTLVRQEAVGERLNHPHFGADGPILVTLGGGDVRKPLLQALEAMPEGVPVTVSVTAQCPLDELLTWERNAPDLRRINTDPDRLIELLAGACLAVTGAGTTLWECYVLGIPSVVVFWVGNQRHNAAFVAEKQTSRVLDVLSGFDVPSLRQLVTGLLADPAAADAMVRRQRKLIDGEGAFRVAAGVRDLIGNPRPG